LVLFVAVLFVYIQKQIIVQKYQNEAVKINYCSYFVRLANIYSTKRY